ncbi:MULTISPECIES: hypothetical protein [unclassified Bradyrhizobium]|uniref:hypothetical protein n=1 Tax=unclassified Bradyrhizobium TaxID=2631580 RepID=UPI001FF72260|nr:MULTISPECIES: hypothetical protein [unclassified Bradyrhizobium]MCK1332824.1 hypothetical protein [Bradyrhizobium sp. CW9]MCK1698607.1 hypothetical protein [Bradyrhizobium sp. 144]
MIIFPFGFYILDGKRLIHLGNDLEAQKASAAWLEANNNGHLRSDVIAGAQLLTRFVGFDRSGRSAAMNNEPLLFETTFSGDGEITRCRVYSDCDTALAGHAELLDISRRLH